MSESEQPSETDAAEAPRRFPRIEWIYVKLSYLVTAGVSLLVLVTISILLVLYARGHNEHDLAVAEINAARHELDLVVPHLAEPGVASLAALGEQRLKSAGQLLAGNDPPGARREALVARTLADKALALVTPDPSTSQQARFFRMEGEVMVRRVGSLVWETGSLLEPLYRGDAIRTSEHAAAEIVYSDGRVTTVQASSLIEIESVSLTGAAGALQVAETLNAGTVTLTSSPSAAEGSTHTVGTATSRAVAAARDARMEVSFDPAARSTRLDVAQGEVRLEAGGRGQTVDPDTRVEVDADGHTGAPRWLTPPPELLSPAEARVFHYAQPTETATTFAWGGVKGAQRYRLEVGGDPFLAGAPVRDLDVTGSSMRLGGLDAGWWFWRVRGRDADGVEGRPSEIRAFHILGLGGPRKEHGAAPTLEITETLQAGPIAIFRGQTQPGNDLIVGGRQVIPSGDGRFTAVVRMQNPGPNVITLLARDEAGNEARLERTVYLAR
jgi:hypothetical protein